MLCSRTVATLAALLSLLVALPLATTAASDRRKTCQVFPTIRTNA